MNNTSKLKKRYGDRLVFWGGGCDTQNILPNGPKNKIEEEVKRRIEDLAPGGGFVFCAVHNIQPDVPPENIVAMYEHGREYSQQCKGQGKCQREEKHSENRLHCISTCSFSQQRAHNRSCT